jgi:glutamate-1-semialdehyde 2,1-aminomutase
MMAAGECAKHVGGCVLLEKRQAECLAQGWCGTNSKRSSQYTELHPKFITKAQQCYVWGEDGQRYIDFVGALGANILGYGHPKVDAAIRDQLHTGVVTASMPSPLEVEVAELIQGVVPAAEKVRFLKTGSEACSAALRIARAATGRRIVASEGYHGWHDHFTSLTPPAHGVVDNLAMRRSTDGVSGCIFICEPLSLDPEEDRVELERTIAQEPKLTIFDEVITGFRVPEFTVSRWWHIEPDMIVLGKAMANGMPLSAVAGKKEIMDSDYFVSSTFSGEALSLAACRATILELKQRSLKDLQFYGDRLLKQLNSLDDEIMFEGYGTRAMFNLTNSKSALFAQEMARSGVIFGKAWFYTFAHLEEQVEEYVLNLAYDVVARIRRGEVRYVGTLPSETFKRY